MLYEYIYISDFRKVYLIINCHNCQLCLLRINDKSLFDKLYGLMRHPPEESLGEGELALRYVQVRLLLRVAGKGRIPAEEDVRQDTHRPDVCRQ